jgi:hypothetical protein
MCVGHLMDVPLADYFEFAYSTPDYGTERRLALR